MTAKEKEIYCISNRIWNVNLSENNGYYECKLTYFIDKPHYIIYKTNSFDKLKSQVQAFINDKDMNFKERINGL